MITARRASHHKEVTRNSSFFKKVPNLQGSTIPADLQVPIDFKGLAICQPAATSVTQEESSQAHPSKTNGNHANTTLAAKQSTPSPPVSFRSCRLIKKKKTWLDERLSYD